MTSLTFVRATACGIACVTLLAGCSDGGPDTIGPPSKLVLVASTGLTAPANTVLPSFKISVQDAKGHKLSGETVTFAVTAGGGSINPTFLSAVSDASGEVTVQGWTLGKLAILQTLTASLGAITLPVNATVTTSYQIVVRFWGDQTALTDQNKALFTNAAARIKGIVTGDVQDVSTPSGGFDLANCGIPGQPILNEVIDDVVIYASIQNIDGAGDANGNILAQAGPCAGRTTVTGYHTAIGIMEFDSYDFPSLAGAGGQIQEVVTHEMLHVLGFGVYWEGPPTTDNPGSRDLITGSGSGDPRYNGTNGRQGCVAVGGTITCASSVPAENAGGAGSENTHWREATFASELMTSRLNLPPNPISAMTIGSLVDLGFVVNSADSDPYTIPGGSILASKAALLGPSNPKWERVLRPSFLFMQDGTVRDLRFAPK